MRPAHNWGEVRPGSSSIQGMAHLERPATLAKAGSTGVLPTSRLIQLTATSKGSILSNMARSCWGPRTQPQVASLKGDWTLRAAAIAVVKSLVVMRTCSSLVPSHVQDSGVHIQIYSSG